MQTNVLGKDLTYDGTDGNRVEKVDELLIEKKIEYFTEAGLSLITKRPQTPLLTAIQKVNNAFNNSISFKMKMDHIKYDDEPNTLSARLLKQGGSPILGQVIDEVLVNHDYNQLFEGLAAGKYTLEVKASNIIGDTFGQTQVLDIYPVVTYTNFELTANSVKVSPVNDDVKIVTSTGLEVTVLKSSFVGSELNYAFTTPLPQGTQVTVGSLTTPYKSSDAVGAPPVELAPPAVPSDNMYFYSTTAGVMNKDTYQRQMSVVAGETYMTSASITANTETKSFAIFMKYGNEYELITTDELPPYGQGNWLFTPRWTNDLGQDLFIEIYDNINRDTLIVSGSIKYLMTPQTYNTVEITGYGFGMEMPTEFKTMTLGFTTDNPNFYPRTADWFLVEQDNVNIYPNTNSLTTEIRANDNRTVDQPIKVKLTLNGTDHIVTIPVIESSGSKS